MMELFESEQSVETEFEDRTDDTASVSDPYNALVALAEAASEAIKVTNDSTLQDALRVVILRIDELKDVPRSVPKDSKNI